MSEDKLKKWNTICAIAVVIFAVIEIIVIAAVTDSAYNNTVLSNASDAVIKALAYTPWALFCIAIVLRLYFASKIKKIESKKNEDRIKELEAQIKQLMK